MKKLHSNIKYSFLICLILIFFCLCDKNTIKWKSISWDYEKVTSQFVFGTIKLIDDEKTEKYFGYQSMNLSFTNKICELLGFSDFYSFIIKGKLKKSYSIIFFNLTNNQPKKF